jgi:hypothetical protein
MPETLLYLSLTADGLVGGLSVANEDIAGWDGAGATMYFDGSDVGLASSSIDAFAITGPDEILMSFAASVSLPGIGTVDDSDIVRFRATSLGSNTDGTFSMYFDGSDVGLSTNSEDIDAVELLSNGDILVSTTGSVSVPGVSGSGEDILRFVPASLGGTTAGTWSVYFDGSDVGLSGSAENLDALAVDPGGRLYLSTSGAFGVTGISGGDEDVFTFTPLSLGAATSGTFSPTLFFDGSTAGIGNNDVGGIDLP